MQITEIYSPYKIILQFNKCLCYTDYAIIIKILLEKKRKLQNKYFSQIYRNVKSCSKYISYK